MTKEEAKRILASCFIGVVLALLVVIIAEQQRELKRRPKEVTKTVTVTKEVIVKEIEELIVDNNTYQYDVPLESEVLDFIQVCSEYYHIPVPLILAIIQTESGYDQNAISGTNDHGLMQVNLEYFDFFVNFDLSLFELYQIPKDEPLNPHTSILAGCNAYTYWKQEAKKFDFFGIVDVLNMYNRGYKYVSDGNTKYSNKVVTNLKTILSAKH